MEENTNKNRLEESSTKENSTNDKSVSKNENIIKDDLTGKILFGKYKVLKKIGDGSQSTIYSGENIKTGEGVAIKAEKQDAKDHLLEEEMKILSTLKNHEGIVDIIACGRKGHNFILIEKLLGKSLDILFLDSSKKFTLFDICQIAIQCLDRLEYIHSKGIIHCDIKPENFAIGVKDPNIIYMIDFGLCQDYIDIKTGKHKSPIFTGYMTGTARYASRNALTGKQLSRRDDIESFMYMILYFLSKKLPWQGTRAKSITARYKKIYLAKKNFNYKEFCKNYPKEITTCVEYILFLGFKDKPNYEYMRKLFRKILKENNFTKKDFFSWMENMKDLDVIRKRAHSETKSKILEQKKKIHSSILKLSTIGGLKESTMAVANLKLSKIDINESTINLGESQITVCQDEKNENKDNIEDDIQDDFVPDEVPIEDKEEDDKEEIIENEEKGECSDSQNKVFSTEVKFREKLEKNEEDKNENKIELKKDLEVIEEVNEEDEEEMENMAKKRGGSVHVYIYNTKDEYKNNIDDLIKKNREKEINKEKAKEEEKSENVDNKILEDKIIKNNHQNKYEDLKKKENDEIMNKNNIGHKILIKKEEKIIEKDKANENKKDISFKKDNVKEIKPKQNNVSVRSNSFSNRNTSNKLKEINSKIFNNNNNVNLKKDSKKKVSNTDDKIKYSSIGSQDYNRKKKGNNLGEKNKNCNII